MENIKILNADHPCGLLTHALFDFDGTISLIRYGWEEVMQEVMEEMIAGPNCPVSAELRNEIAAYIDESTGILTIYQMRWLKEAVKRWELNPLCLTVGEYKQIYNRRLLARKVDERLVSEPNRGTLILAGAERFLQSLAARGVELILSSGTDDEYVRREAAFLGVDSFFGDRLHGALEDTEEYSKENIIRRILGRKTAGEKTLLAVFGDGPVEIQAAREHRALSVGVASNEEIGRGWNERKVRRLTHAGADILIPDFIEGHTLLSAIENANIPLG